MKETKNFSTILVILALLLTNCTTKATAPQTNYKEPLSFDIFKPYEDVPLDTNYIKKAYETWNYELKDDETIKNHTWIFGDYKVLAYLHSYMLEIIDASYDEVLFFTTTKPKKGTDKIHSTITVFHAELENASIELSKIKTYAYVNNYHPIKNEDEARKVMINYLDEYIAKFDSIPFDSFLIGQLKSGRQPGCHLKEWGDHYVYFAPPLDFGGAIIVNKLSSKLDFLGTSVSIGSGRRYFPLD